MPVVYNSDSMKIWRMKARKEFNEKNKPVVISDNNDKGNTEFTCKYCQRIIRSKFTDDSIWCNSCCAETIFEKDTKPIKKGLKVETMDSDEVYVNTTGELTSPFDKQPIQYQGGFKVLSEKGIRITSYSETLPQSGQSHSWNQGSGSTYNTNKVRRVPGQRR